MDDEVERGQLYHQLCSLTREDRRPVFASSKKIRPCRALAIGRCLRTSGPVYAQISSGGINTANKRVSKAADKATGTADPCTTIVRPCGNSSGTSRRRPARRLRDSPLPVRLHPRRRRRSRLLGPVSILLFGPHCNS